jgi:plastocyanin
MSRRTLARAAVPALGLAVALAAVVPATAQNAPSKATLNVVGKPEFKANRYVKDSMRFGRDITVVKSGGTLTIVNKTDQPHSFSLVKKSQLARNMAAMEGCFSPNGACGKLMVAHGFIDPATGEEREEPTTPLVHVGKEGFDQPGDSVVFRPKSKTKVKITAKKGAQLSFLCGFHPWMQGKLDVK